MTEMSEKVCYKVTDNSWWKKIYGENHFGHSQCIWEAIRYIHANYAKDISLNEVAHHVYRSPEHLSRLFKEKTGEKFSTYLISYRLDKAKIYC